MSVRALTERSQDERTGCTSFFRGTSEFPGPGDDGRSYLASTVFHKKQADAGFLDYPDSSARFPRLREAAGVKRARSERLGQSATFTSRPRFSCDAGLSSSERLC